MGAWALQCASACRLQPHNALFPIPSATLPGTASSLPLEAPSRGLSETEADQELFSKYEQGGQAGEVDSQPHSVAARPFSYRQDTWCFQNLIAFPRAHCQSVCLTETHLAWDTLLKATLVAFRVDTFLSWSSMLQSRRNLVTTLDF